MKTEAPSGGDLVIDRVTPLQRPSAEQMRAWAARQRVFISSTMVDPSGIRQQVAGTIADLGAESVMFESLGARSDDSRQAYTEEVRRSSIYLGILSRFYGGKLKSGYSATHEEYGAAVESRKEILLFLDDSVPDSERDGNLNRWIKDLYQFHVVAKYQNNDDLLRLVRTSLGQLAANELSPWVKLGAVVFQATKISRTLQAGANSIAITTACQDPRITALLLGWSKPQIATPTLRLTDGRDSFAVKLESVEDVVDPAGGSSLTLKCKTVDNQEHFQRAPAFLLAQGGYGGPSGNYTYRDLVELALRCLVLGQEPPKDPMFGSMPRLELRALYLRFGDDSQIFAKVLQLLLVEAIYEHNLVDRVVRLAVGRVRNGKIPVTLTAVLPKFYSDVEAESVGLEGDITLL